MAETIGRDEQIGALETVLARATDGHGSALIVRGEAGIGKTLLLERAVQAARERGMRVLTATGVQAEVHVPYAGLDQLLRPLRNAPEAVESPYRLAIEILGLLGEPDEPTLLAVEDAHWLDLASWETLTFLCRRVESDRVAVVMTVRDGADIGRRVAAAGLPELRLEPLSPADAGALLDRIAPGLNSALRVRVLDEAAGNPLGLVELGSLATRAGDSALLPSSLPLTVRLEQTFGGLVADLPPSARDLLLIAALDDGGNLDEILAAAAVLTRAAVSTEAIQPAVTARLVTVDERYEVRFRHPLLRSALRQQAPPGDRRRVHAALAEVLSDHPERGVWHRASAVAGTDEALARELVDAAQAALGRQAVGFALAAVERAVELSQDPGARGSRQLWAADLARDQGDSLTERRLLDTVDSSLLRPVDRARLAWMRERDAAWAGEERLLAYAELIDSMRRDGEPDLALTSILHLSLRLYHSELSPQVRDRFVKATLACGIDDDDPRLPVALLLVAPVEYGVPGLELLRRHVDRLDLAPTERCDLAIAAYAIGAFELGRRFAMSSAADLRSQGRIGALTYSINAAASTSASLGDVRTALPLAVESEALAAETGKPSWALASVQLRAHAEALRGNAAEARRLVDTVDPPLMAARRFSVMAVGLRARGIAALADGHADEASQLLIRLFDPTDRLYNPHYQLHVLGDLAEAALLGGLLDELRPVVAALEPVAARSGSPALRVGLGFARAVLTGDYETALADDLADWPFDRARLQLSYGVALRRSYRIAESRPYLRAAATTFDGLGTTPWADRARSELRATGETRRKPMDALATLTPQEQQIARLTAEGLSNREIGARLFLSPRTVSTHLYRIYPKINVRSRAELARVITASEPQRDGASLPEVGDDVGE